MGCTTTFQGEFKFDRDPSLKVIRKLRALEDQDTRELEGEYPSNYCQWVLTKNLDGLKWDGGEKFYGYVEWLQWIIDHILLHAGMNLTGRVAFKDDYGDRGFVVVEHNIACIEQEELVGDAIEELREFRDFVLKHRDFDRTDLKNDWLERND